MGSNRWLVERKLKFHLTIHLKASLGRQSKSNSNTKSNGKSSGEGTNQSLYSTGLVYPKGPSEVDRCSATSLDKAAFLIDGLTLFTRHLHPKMRRSRRMVSTPS